MRRSHVLLTLCSTVAFVTVGVACQIGSDCDFGLCPGEPIISSPDGSTGDAPTDATADVVQPPVGCEPLKDPKDSPKCIDDAYGVFVAPNGAAGAAGTRTSPVGSITEALTKLDTPNGRKPRIYVCAGDYSESVSLSTAVAVYGGLDCGTWAPGAAKPKFTAQAPGEYALRVSGGADVSVTDLEFIAQPAGQAAVSSIAAFVSEATGKVQFTRVSLTANDAANGPDGADGTTMTFTSSPTAATTRGNDAVGMTGGAAQTCTCSDGKTTVGGKGANQNEMKGAPGTPALLGGAGGDSGAPCANGGDGSDSTSQGASAAATALGVLDVSGWKPGNGVDGLAGVHGQGGGGGGSRPFAPNEGGGGSGACGGCGGTGGGGGKGGGASIALLVFSSPNLSLTQVTTTTKTAGKGGDGKAGGTGAAGGARGNGAGGACNGGNGGKGGDGGAGGGGAGGVSAGVLYKGAKPTGDYAWTGPSAKAARGESPGNPGIEGESAKELEIK